MIFAPAHIARQTIHEYSFTLKLYFNGGAREALGSRAPAIISKSIINPNITNFLMPYVSITQNLLLELLCFVETKLNSIIYKLSTNETIYIHIIRKHRAY